MLEGNVSVMADALRVGVSAKTMWELKIMSVAQHETNLKSGEKICF
jgi:hypothetical protein